MIQIENLHKKFGKLPVLTGIDLSIDKGGIYTILGPNGSGKTTLIKSILGMVIPDSGNISIQGENTRKGWNYRKQIDYLPQIANFPGNLTVKELIKMIKDLRGIEANDRQFIELFSLEPHLSKKLGNLSGGTKQKVNLVLTFMFDSPIIILDEPSTGLDPLSILRLKDHIQKLKEKGKMVLVTSHIMSLVEEISDEIVFLLDGKVYFKGGVSKLKEQTAQPDFERAIAALLLKNNA